MNNRYEIQDILAQDASGVVFHAEDRESKREVVLRRFFPFGVDGGGLEGEEQIAYEIAVRRLMDVDHPSLRRVLDGGSDPVDGMPFLVTEWHEGEPLSERLKIRALSPPSAKALVDLALECSQILSDTFQEETVWIETEPNSIILGGSESDRKVTFWISPLRWLGDADARKGLQPLVDMIEVVTGWDARTVPDQAGDGLGWWFKTLKSNPETWNLEQARTALLEGPPVAQPTGTVPITPPSTLSSGPQTIPASPVQLPAASSAPIWPWITAGVLSTAAIAFVAWQFFSKPTAAPSLAIGMEKESIHEGMSDRDAAAIASARAAEISAALQSADRPLSPTVGEPFTLESSIAPLRQSRSKKTIYLPFAEVHGTGIVGIRYHTKHKTIEPSKLKELVEAKIRVTGKVVNEPSGLMIDLTDLDQIETLGD